MKKEKKQKIKEQEVVLGEKIRDVKINERQHFLLFVAMLILVNFLLVFSVGFVLIYLNRWYNWVICFAIIAICFWLSLISYTKIKNFHKVELYKNAIAINSIWFNYKVDLKDIYEMKAKTSFLDKAFHLQTKSLEVKILGHRRKKFTIHFIEENVINLKMEIMELIEKHCESINAETIVKKEKTSK